METQDSSQKPPLPPISARLAQNGSQVTSTAREGLPKSEEGQGQTVEFLRTILDAIPAHVAVLDRYGKIIFINQSWRRFSGNPEGSCEHLKIGQNYIQYCEVADHAFDGMGLKLAVGICKVLQSNAPSYELTHPLYQDGKRRWYRVSATSLNLNDGNGAVIMYHDVTEQNQAEEQIHVQSSLLDLDDEPEIVQY